jgi:phage shock protein A
LFNLLSGGLSHWLTGRERRNPGAVYEAAIQARLEQYVKLREAAAGVIYMRSKLAKEFELKSAELKSLSRQLDIAVERDEDEVALTLITRRDGLQADVARLGKELEELTSEADSAKKSLITFQGDVARLRDEKLRALARLANAKARLRLQETIKGLSPDADIQALEEVRAHVDRLVAEVQVSREVTDTELEKRLEGIRSAEATAAAKAQLDELKRAKKRALVPVNLPQQAAAVTA